MTTIAAMARRLSGVNITQLAGIAMTDEPNVFVDLNRKQMLSGKDSEGKEIVPAYTFATVAIKREKGQEADFVTLKDTGSFQSKMYLMVKGNVFSVDSLDDKRDKIIAKYGEEIFGLTSENKRIAWNEILRPNVVRQIANITGCLYG